MVTKHLEQGIKVFDFATVVADKKMKGSGLSRGDEVLVMASKDVAFKKDDPWLKRTYFIVAKVGASGPQIPSTKNDYMSVVVDPRNLELVSEERAEELSVYFKQ